MFPRRELAQEVRILFVEHPAKNPSNETSGDYGDCIPPEVVAEDGNEVQGCRRGGWDGGKGHWARIEIVGGGRSARRVGQADADSELGQKDR